MTALLHWRIRNGISQSQLGEMLKVTAQAISKWEKGTGRPELEHIYALELITNQEITLRDWVWQYQRVQLEEKWNRHSLHADEVRSIRGGGQC